MNELEKLSKLLKTNIRSWDDSIVYERYQMHGLAGKYVEVRDLRKDIGHGVGKIVFNGTADEVMDFLKKEKVSEKNYSYKGKTITASSKKEAIKKIIAGRIDISEDFATRLEKLGFKREMTGVFKATNMSGTHISFKEDGSAELIMFVSSAKVKIFKNFFSHDYAIKYLERYYKKISENINDFKNLMIEAGLKSEPDKK